jgi:hypothetical protein
LSPVQAHVTKSVRSQVKTTNGYLVMADQSKHTGGVPFHVGECYIWAAIFYLDSFTDYRECLARHSVHLRSLACDDLIMLDSLKQPPISRTKRRLALECTVPFLLLLVAGMFLYLIWYL